jgi:hypothetical protein
VRALAVLTFTEQIEDADDRGKQCDATENNEVRGHQSSFLANAMAQPISVIQTATPAAIAIGDNGRSLMNCPKNTAPAATFAVSASVSTNTDRCRRLNLSIVDPANRCRNCAISVSKVLATECAAIVVPASRLAERFPVN